MSEGSWFLCSSQFGFGWNESEFLVEDGHRVDIINISNSVVARNCTKLADTNIHKWGRQVSRGHVFSQRFSSI